MTQISTAGLAPNDISVVVWFVADLSAGMLLQRRHFAVKRTVSLPEDDKLFIVSTALFSLHLPKLLVKKEKRGKGKGEEDRQ